MVDEVIEESRNASLRVTHKRNYRDVAKNRNSVLVGVALSLMIHTLALWLLTDRASLDAKTPLSDTGNRVTITLAPSVPPAPPQSKIPQPVVVPKPEKKSSPAPAIANKKQAKKPAIAVDRMPPDMKKTAPGPTRSMAEPPDLSLPGDMYTQIEEARKRRADALANSGLPDPALASSAKEKVESDNSIASANVEFSLNRPEGADRVDAGGIFQVRRVGYRDAEFLFRGWNTRSRRHSTRLITVDQGADVDIQTAIVKKMIDIIREEKKEDFLWQSARMGRQITLSARPQDNADLQRFLLQEFFPAHRPRGSGR